MKKIFSLVTLFFTVMIAFANPTDEYTCYFADQTVQAGSTVDLQLTINKTNDIGTVVCNLQVPTGVTINSVKGVGATTFNPDNNNKLVLGGCEGNTVVATVNVTISADMEPGTYDMSILDYQLVEPSLQDYTGTKVTTTLTVQREAVIASLPEGYGFEVIPFAPAVGENTINFNFKATAAVRTIEFDLQLPQGLLMYDSSFGETAPVINTAATQGTPTVTLTNVSDDRTCAHVALTGAAGLSKKYFKAATDYITCATLTTLVLTDQQIADNGLSDSYKIQEGVQQIKLSNISMQDNTNTTTYYTGDYIASVFVGTPTETDPIVYGHYTAEGQAALKSASTNFASVDMKVATLDATESAVAQDLAGILVYGPKSTSYYRDAKTTYSTVCLPYALEKNDNVKYYALESATADKLTFAPVDNVDAATPAIFMGTINTSVTGYQYANPSATGLTAETVSGLTLTGTYKKTSVADGAGYYLSNNKFYSDGATVAPFRAYFEGSAGVKTFSIAIHDETGIHDITSQLSNEDIYNLQGIRMQNTQKGVNIVGGKKVYIKK